MFVMKTHPLGLSHIGFQCIYCKKAPIGNGRTQALWVNMQVFQAAAFPKCLSILVLSQYFFFIAVAWFFDNLFIYFKLFKSDREQDRHEISCTYYLISWISTVVRNVSASWNSACVPRRWQGPKQRGHHCCLHRCTLAENSEWKRRFSDREFQVPQMISTAVPYSHPLANLWNDQASYSLSPFLTS